MGVSFLDNQERTEKYAEELTLDDILNEDLYDILYKQPEEPVAEKPKPTPTRKAKQKNREEKRGWQSTLLTYLHDLVYLLAGLILVFLLLFRVVVVSGSSMNDTLLEGDYLLLLGNTFYQNPQYGDVIVVSKEGFRDGEPIVKRVIATEGQWIGIDFEMGIVYVGDTKDTLKPLEEGYTLTPTLRPEDFGEHTPENPLEVSQGCLFVMGDNREVSQDSRDDSIGLVDKREVLGKVFFLFYPGVDNNTQEKNFDRIGVVN